jgi:hypothetical protein
MPKGIYLRSLETIYKLKKNGFQKGKPSKFLGHIPTKEMRENNRQKHLGKHPSEETKNKMSIAHKGNKHLLGKKFSELTKLKMSLKRRGKDNPNFGKHLSDKTKEKIRLARTEFLKNICGISGKLGRYESQILNEIEILFGYKIIRQFYIMGYWLDGYIVELNLAIEIDEDKHFQNGKLRKKDVERQIIIEKALNCRFIRIKEKDYLKAKEN